MAIQQRYQQSSQWDKEVHRCFTSKEKFTDRENRAATKANKILDKFENFIVTRLSSWGEQSRCLNDQAEFKEMVAHYANMFFIGTEEDEKKQNQTATAWMIANIIAFNASGGNVDIIMELQHAQPVSILWLLLFLIGLCTMA